MRTLARDDVHDWKRETQHDDESNLRRSTRSFALRAPRVGAIACFTTLFSTGAASAQCSPPPVVSIGPPVWVSCDLWTGDTQWVLPLTILPFNACGGGGTVAIAIDAKNLSSGYTATVWSFSSCSSNGASFNQPFTIDEAGFPTGDPVELSYSQTGDNLASCSYVIDTFTKPGPPAIYETPPTLGPTPCGTTVTLPVPSLGNWDWVDYFQWGRSVGGHGFAPVGPPMLNPLPLTISNLGSSDSGIWVLQGFNCFSASGMLGLSGWQFNLDVGESPTYGQGCAGAGGYIPSLRLYGCLTPGATTTLEVADALGGSMATLFIGASSANIPMGLGCRLLVQPIFPVSISFPLGGTGAGSGSTSIAIGLPTNMPQASLAVQAFVLDAASPLGFSNSNGVAVVIQ